MAKGNIHNKDPFLDHVAKSLGRKRQEGKVEKPNWMIQPQLNVLVGSSQDELVDVLKAQCKNIHTDFYQTIQEELADTLSKVIQKLGGGSIMLSRDPRFIKYNLDELFDVQLPHANVTVDRWDPNNGKESITKSEKANIGITFSDVTLSESGTVTLFNHKGNGRSISLLPASYIAIIEKSTIVPRMTQAAQLINKQHAKGADIPSCVSFISGPSNSADIEMNLIVGVHGPVKVSYVVLDDES